MPTAASQPDDPCTARRRVPYAGRYRCLRPAALAMPCLLATSVLAQAPVPSGAPAAEPAAAVLPALTRAEQEAFLREARIIRSRSAPGGITGSRRVTLSNGVFTHNAHVQGVDVAKSVFQGSRGVELNFRDSWRYNVAAYRLSVLLGLDMVPVTVQRYYDRGPAAFTWWVDDVMMDEGTRLKRKVRAPDVHAWNQQMYVVRVFDQLIYNVDRNLGNLLITGDWRVWMIDHTRAFRRHRTLNTIGDLKGCDRTLLARLEALDKPTLERELSDWLDLGEMEGLLARRDVIVQFFKGAPADALFDLPRRDADVDEAAALASARRLPASPVTAEAERPAPAGSGPPRR